MKAESLVYMRCVGAWTACSGITLGKARTKDKKVKEVKNDNEEL